MAILLKELDKINLSKVANIEKKLPKSYISKDGFGVTGKCKEYLKPLIEGEAFTPYKNGLPVKAILKNKLDKKKLKEFS